MKAKLFAATLLTCSSFGANAMDMNVAYLTIEEIGFSGVGTSAAGTGGGLFYFATSGAVPDGSSGISFVSAGTTDAGLFHV